MQVWLLILLLNAGTPDQETIIIDYGVPSWRGCLDRGEAAQKAWLDSEFICDSTMRWEV